MHKVNQSRVAASKARDCLNSEYGALFRYVVKLGGPARDKIEDVRTALSEMAEELARTPPGRQQSLQHL